MASALDYIDALALGSQVSSLTGKSVDGITAGAFSAFVQAVTGSLPQVVSLPGNKAKVILSQAQAGIMQKWLDTQLWSALRKPAGDTLFLEMNPAIVPWALKYLIPVALIFAAAGWLGHWYFAR